MLYLRMLAGEHAVLLCCAGADVLIQVHAHAAELGMAG